MVVALLTAGAGFHLAAAQDIELDVKITEINSEGEYIVIENQGNTEYDLSGLTVAFDDNQDKYTLPEGTVLQPGESITVGTGSETAINADYNAGYDGPVLNNQEPDIVELMDGGDTVVSGIEGEANGNGGSGEETTDETTTEDSSDDTTTTSEDTTTTTSSEDTTTTTSSEDTTTTTSSEDDNNDTTTTTTEDGSDDTTTTTTTTTKDDDC